MFRNDPTLQLVALWDDQQQSRSRLSIYGATGQRLSTYDHPGRLLQLAIDRPTSHHGRKIIVAGADETSGPHIGIRRPVASVSVLDTKSKPLWAGVVVPSTERITRLEITDGDNDAKRDISVSTENGNVLLDFSGNVIGLRSTTERLQFKRCHRSRDGADRRAASTPHLVDRRMK